MNKKNRLFISIAFLFILGVLLNTTNTGKNIKTLLGSTITKLGVDTMEYSWYFKPRTDGEQPTPNTEASFFSKYGTYYVGKPQEKVIYLTFDAGYENGYTEKLLDTLKKHNAPAAFFVVKSYIKTNPDLVKRMVDEGHLVCNHSTTHPSMANITDFEKFSKELTAVDDAYKELIGKEMPKYFRPPMGKFSELSLKYTQKLGYKTIFWSFAYVDWLNDNQPTHEYAKTKIFTRTHPGAIVLLHPNSKTNCEVLDDVITEWKKQGYTLKSLDYLSGAGIEKIDKKNIIDSKDN